MPALWPRYLIECSVATFAESNHGVHVEAAPRVLAAMSEESSRNAERQLRRIYVELMLNTIVTGVDDAGVTHGRGHIASHTVIWAAGVAASPLGVRLVRRPTRPGACW